MLFRKRYFIDNEPDKDEIALEAESGDLTVHSGRIWHRAALASVEGAASKKKGDVFPYNKRKIPTKIR